MLKTAFLLFSVVLLLCGGVVASSAAPGGQVLSPQPSLRGSPQLRFLQTAQKRDSALYKNFDRLYEKWFNAMGLAEESTIPPKIDQELLSRYPGFILPDDDSTKKVRTLIRKMRAFLAALVNRQLPIETFIRASDDNQPTSSNIYDNFSADAKSDKTIHDIQPATYNKAIEEFLKIAEMEKEVYLEHLVPDLLDGFPKCGFNHKDHLVKESCSAAKKYKNDRTEAERKKQSLTHQEFFTTGFKDALRGTFICDDLESLFKIAQKLQATWPAPHILWKNSFDSKYEKKNDDDYDEFYGDFKCYVENPVPNPVPGHHELLPAPKTIVSEIQFHLKSINDGSAQSVKEHHHYAYDLMKDIKPDDALIPTVKTICQAEWAFAYCTVDLSAFADEQYKVHVGGEDVTVDVLQKLCTGSSDGVAEGSDQAKQVLANARTAILAMQVVGTTPGSFNKKFHKAYTFPLDSKAEKPKTPKIRRNPQNAGSHLKKKRNRQAENPKKKWNSSQKADIKL